MLHSGHLIYLTIKNNTKDTWVETRTYPGSRYQAIFSIILLTVSLLAFLFLSSVDNLSEIIFFLFFVMLTFSVMAFPQYREFSGMAKDLEIKGVAKANNRAGIQRLLPLFAFLSILFIVPVLMLFLVPPSQFFVSIIGIITGFALFQLFFVLYVKRWEKKHNLTVKRYTLLNYDDQDRRVILEYGLRVERG
jgi:hypothetical protein